MESIIVQTYITHLPGELAKKWHMGSVQRLSLHHQQRAKRSSIGVFHANAMFAVAFSLMKHLATAPSLLQRMFVRSAQPFFVSGIIMAFYVVIHSPLNIGIFAVVFASFVGVVSYFYLKETFRRNAFAVLPASGNDTTTPGSDEILPDGENPKKNYNAFLEGDQRNAHIPIIEHSSEFGYNEDEKDMGGLHSFDRSSIDVHDISAVVSDNNETRSALELEESCKFISIHRDSISSLDDLSVRDDNSL
mmetsp:Transcript_20951/g.30022  ORF Transcript_20951/g.30022 Transcript_20951/m.30022 type:complete len:247 (-) Transcript_20951:242-982(-)